jgi:hypothetical protein
MSLNTPDDERIRNAEVRGSTPSAPPKSLSNFKKRRAGQPAVLLCPLFWRAFDAPRRRVGRAPHGPGAINRRSLRTPVGCRGHRRRERTSRRRARRRPGDLQPHPPLSKLARRFHGRVLPGAGAGIASPCVCRISDKLLNRGGCGNMAAPTTKG